MQEHYPILPAGLKLEDLRVADDDTPLQPGEFRDVDAPGGSLREGLCLYLTKNQVVRYFNY